MEIPATSINAMKYILTKYETITRVEQVEYDIEIPERVRNKIQYASDELSENSYQDCRVVDILNSDLIDEETISIRKVKRPQNLPVNSASTKKNR